MGTDLEKGTSYSDGDQVNAANLNAHVDSATIKYTAISSRSLKDPAAPSDELLINDNGILKKITLQQISVLLTIPVGTVNDYAGSTAPTGWLMCYGQAVSRTTYASLFGVIGVAFGAGDGSSTFSLPDCRGRVSAGKDNMGGVSANRMTEVVDADVLGNTGGAEKYVLLTAELAAHTHTGPLHAHHMQPHQHTIAPHTHSTTGYVGGGGVGSGVAGSGYTLLHTPLGNPTMNSLALTTDPNPHQDTDQNGNQATSSVGTGQAHDNVQPTIIFNKIIKI